MYICRHVYDKLIPQVECWGKGDNETETAWFQRPWGEFLALFITVTVTDASHTWRVACVRHTVCTRVRSALTCCAPHCGSYGERAWLVASKMIFCLRRLREENSPSVKVTMLAALESSTRTAQIGLGQLTKVPNATETLTFLCALLNAQFSEAEEPPLQNDNPNYHLKSWTANMYWLQNENK